MNKEMENRRLAQTTSRWDRPWNTDGPRPFATHLTADRVFMIEIRCLKPGNGMYQVMWTRKTEAYGKPLRARTLTELLAVVKQYKGPPELVSLLERATRPVPRLERDEVEAVFDSFFEAGLAFHPDESLHNYVFNSGEPAVNPEAAEALDDYLVSAFEKYGDELYDMAYEALELWKERENA